METLNSIIESGIVHLIVVCVAVVAMIKNFLSVKWSENSRVHVLYISGILVFLIIELVTYICIQNDTCSNIMPYISFAATLSSLILSIVAIIYSIVTNNKGDDVFVKIEDRTKDLVKETEKFQSVAAQLIKDLSTIKSGMTNIQSIAEETNQQLKVIQNSNSISPDRKKINEDEEYIKNSILYGSLIGNAGLLACYYSQKYNKPFKSTELFKNNSEYVYGYIIAYSTLFVINVEIVDDVFTITSAHPKLLDFLKEFFINQGVGKSTSVISGIIKFFSVKEDFWSDQDNNTTT